MRKQTAPMPVAEGEGFTSPPKDAPNAEDIPHKRTARVVEGSVVRPLLPPASKASAGKDTPSANSADLAGGDSWYEQDMPYEDLVGYLDHFVEQARARPPETGSPFSKTDPFNAAEWLGWQLQKKATSETKAPFIFYDLANAWDALASDHYTAEGGEWGKYVRNLLATHIDMTKQTSLTLPPKSVKLLDAMAEVAGIPRKRGEATIDLTPFARPDDTPHSPTPGK